MRHGSPRLDRVRGRFRNRLPDRKHHTTETSTRRWSGMLAGRCVLYPPHSTVLPPLTAMFTEPVNSRMVGYSEVGRKRCLGRDGSPAGPKTGHQTDALLVLHERDSVCAFPRVQQGDCRSTMLRP
jgi:hypothetical protein